MPSPFPGMNPYLENPELWPEVHHRLISAIANAIESNLSQDYRVAIEKRVYTSVPEDAVLVGIPDASVVSQSSNRQSTNTLTTASDSSITVMLPVPEEIRESYLEIRDIATGAVITAIEVLSPTNKRPGKGRDTYEKKRNAVLESATHLVEIDLLREGTPMVMVGNVPQSHYRILVSRAPQRPRAQLYAFNLQQMIPTFPLPLKPQDIELSVDLQSLLLQIYNQARYDLAIDYHQDPIPSLQEADRTWANTLLQAKRVR
ncbi:hypothetical protein WA1_28165 [Scytonema hofmannii PCC 7110]|uniref:DUF4058 domain-containing protein n=1 Tax=Scytonema hofmannii PCC 7110 TaxID=128403 RepID=A0A139X566_9CYAN|nr:DUF4058 family protein [Scytonema hofmannii]KYC39847.1 hypothetical protein WA1_28165 [Scytonema hofmannii PCC 7110]